MNKLWGLILIGITATGGAIVWSLFVSETPEWREVQQLQSEIRESAELKSENESEEEREKREELQQEQFAQYREKLKSLPEELQKKARQQMGNLFVSRMQGKIDLVLSLPPEERDAELDKQIDEWDRRRAAWEKRSEQSDNAQQGKNSTTAADGNANGSGSQNAQASDGKKNSRGRGWWRGASKEQRDTWRRELLSRTTAEQRAKWHEYRRLMDERRKERGLPTR